MAPLSRRRTGYLLILPTALWLGMFFVVPLYSLLASSLYDPTGSVLTGYDMTWHFANYWDALSEYWPILLRSLVVRGHRDRLLPHPWLHARVRHRVQVGAMEVRDAGAGHRAVLHELPAAHALVEAHPRGRRIHRLDAARSSSCIPDEGRLLATPVAVVAGLTYNFLPFMILPLYASLDKIDTRLHEASGDLYANPVKTFFKVTWPLSLPGVVAGTLLTFIPASGDYINADLLGSPNERMVGNVIQNLFTTTGDYALAGALSVILMVIIVAMVLFYIRKAGTEELL